MKATAAAKLEYEVEAAIEQVHLANGAMTWYYPSIVGSGPNATILPYGESSWKMKPGVLLVEAAGSLQGLTGDITRPTPVSGTFSPPIRKELYQLVLLRSRQAWPRPMGVHDVGAWLMARMAATYVVRAFCIDRAFALIATRAGRRARREKRSVREVTRSLIVASGVPLLDDEVLAQARGT